MKKLLSRPTLTFCFILATLFAAASFQPPAANSAPEAPEDKPKSGIKPFASSGSTGLYIVQGSGAGRSIGDFFSADDALDTFYRYFIEVPSGLSRLQVDIFDADFGAGGAAEATAGRDRARNAFNSSVTYTLIDPSGTTRTTIFTTGNTTAPTGADNNWLTFFNISGNTVRDNFGTAAYTNNDGNNNWSGAWAESDGGGGGATGGAIQITGGELRLQDDVSGTPSIQREADLLGTPGLNLTTAFLTFTYRTSNNLEDSDEIRVEISGNGGTTWTTLETFFNDSSGSRTYNITTSIANNTRVRFILEGGYTGSEFFFVDNLEINGGGPITAGHWELRVNSSSSVTTGDDINAFGLRAHDGTSGAGGTELPMYFDSTSGFGVNDDLGVSSYNIYPYITSGCLCSANEFDYDINNNATGSLGFTSRTGAFTNNINSANLSANNQWRRNSFSGWTSDQIASDYGIWPSTLTIGDFPNNGNYTVLYMGNFQFGNSANPATAPTANPITNSFRVYLPADTSTTTPPVKPYLEQFITHLSGPNPPVANQGTAFVVTVRMVNPTAHDITFSATANQIRARIPGVGTTYAGFATVTHGTVTAPGIGGTGDVTWNPGILAAGATATLGYRVTVVPTSAGQRVLVTATPASGNGTRAQYLDETGNTTQARATYLFGPLCELAATEGTLAPTEATLIDFAATAYDGGVLLQWNTGYEINNLGFRIYREEKGRRSLVNRELIAGSALLAGAGTPLTAGFGYSWADSKADNPQDALYWLEDVDLNGKVTVHGPFTVRAGTGKLSDAQSSRLISQPLSDYSNQTQYFEQEKQPVKSSNKKTKLRSKGLSSDTVLNGVKLLIREEGWYRVSIADLIAAGLDPNFNPQFLQLFVGGEQQAMMVNSQNGTIEFYATGQDTLFTNTRTYWVTVGQQPGKRISQLESSGKDEGTGSFEYTAELKEKLIYFSAILNADEDNFFGRIITTTPVAHNLTLNKLDSAFGGSTHLEISLQGATSLEGATDHQVRVLLNGTDVGSIIFDGLTRHVESIFASHSLLREGVNTVTLASENGSFDVNLVDYIRLSYRHTYDAENDSLKFAAGADSELEIVRSDSSPNHTIRGFSNASIRVIDITNPSMPQELLGNIAEQDEQFAVTVNIPEGSRRVLMAFTEDKIKNPAAIRSDQPSNLRSRNNQADMVIITHRDFAASLATLKTHRERQRMQVSIIDIEDVYDEFNFGDKSPYALKSFLAATRAWVKPPKFAMLVGDATFDPRNYLQAGDFDLMPTKLVDTPFMETASDDWFADFNSDGTADMFVGRLPVRSAAAADLAVSKIIAYETGIGTVKSSKKALLISDINDGFDFEAASESVQALFPATFAIQEVLRSQSTDDATRTAILGAINSGQGVVNYTGHGTTTVLRGLLLRSTDAPSLTNEASPSVFVMLTCMNGYFHDPTTTGLAEALITGGRGGAVAAWASSALTDPGQQKLIAQRFYSLLFAAPNSKSPKLSLGEIAVKAKMVANSLDVKQTWILFGDPSMQLR